MREVLLIIVCILLYGSATFVKRVGLTHIHPYQFSLVSGICYGIITPFWFWMIKSSTEITTNSSTKSITLAILYSACSVTAGLILAFLLRRVIIYISPLQVRRKLYLLVKVQKNSHFSNGQGTPL